MSKVHSRQKPHGEHQQSAVKLPILLARDDVRQSRNDHRTLYVLGFGIVGAVLANMSAPTTMKGGTISRDGVKSRRW
jgi:hypothetical protein